MSPRPPNCLAPLCWPSVLILLMGMIFIVVSFREYQRLCHVAQIMPLSYPFCESFSVYLPSVKTEIIHQQRDSRIYSIVVWWIYEDGRVEGFTLVVFSVEMSSMAAVHPPARPFLQGTVFMELVVVFVRCTELHAIVRCVEFVTGIITKVMTIKGITSISTKEIRISQAVRINFWSKFESGVVGIPKKTSLTR